MKEETSDKDFSSRLINLPVVCADCLQPETCLQTHHCTVAASPSHLVAIYQTHRLHCPDVHALQSFSLLDVTGPGQQIYLTAKFGSVVWIYLIKHSKSSFNLAVSILSKNQSYARAKFT